MDTEAYRQASQTATEHYVLLETIAACLRDEGLPAVTHRRLCILPTEITLIAEKKSRLFKQVEILYTITVANGKITIWKDEPWYKTDHVPIAVLDLADPNVFQKVKQAAPCPTPASFNKKALTHEPERRRIPNNKPFQLRAS
jgi:hypothetical protein